MAATLKALINGAKALAIGNSGSKAALQDLFPAVDPAVDGEDCDHDCDSCTIQYPKGFKIEENDDLYGFVKGWSTHVLIATGKTDWVHDASSEKGSVMQAIAGTKAPTNGVCLPLGSLPYDTCLTHNKTAAPPRLRLQHPHPARHHVLLGTHNRPPPPLLHHHRKRHPRHGAHPNNLHRLRLRNNHHPAHHAARPAALPRGPAPGGHAGGAQGPDDARVPARGADPAVQPEDARRPLRPVGAAAAQGAAAASAAAGAVSGSG